MKNLNHKKAFTLIELLTVVIIIGMISSIALITLKDTGEIKAKKYTKEVIQRIKDAIVYEYKEKDYIEGFLNDFGVVPPNIHFLTNQEGGKNHFMHQSDEEKGLQKYKINDVFKVPSSDTKYTKVPMPFISTESKKIIKSKEYFVDSDLAESLLEKEDIKENIYTGYLNDYVSNNIDSDKEKAIKDGWNSYIELEHELTFKDTPIEHKFYLQIISKGSDKTRANDKKTKLRDEFNEMMDSKTLKGFLKNDIIGKYKQSYFIPKRLIDINVKIKPDEKGKTPEIIKVLIYSPMLYYVKDGDGLICTPKNNQKAQCSNGAQKYIPYLEYHPDYQKPKEKENWYSGFIKFELDSDGNIVKINNGTPTKASYKSYIPAGEKLIVILKKESETSGKWEYENSYKGYFMPNRKIVLTRDKLDYK